MLANELMAQQQATIINNASPGYSPNYNTYPTYPTAPQPAYYPPGLYAGGQYQQPYGAEPPGYVASYPAVPPQK